MAFPFKVKEPFASFWGSRDDTVALVQALREQGPYEYQREVSPMHMKAIIAQRLARIRGRARAASERPDYSKASSYLQPLVTSDAQTEVVDPAERRRHKRVQVESAAIVRRIGARNFEVALEDISAGGCRVVMMEPGAVGDPVIARMPDLEPLGSRVSWAHGKVAGVQFLKTIHPAVFDMLLSRLSEGEASAS